MIKKISPLFFVFLFIFDVNAAEIKITSPSPGTKYKQGDSIRISATTDVQGDVMFVSLFDYRVIKEPPYEYIVKIPDNIVGSVVIGAGIFNPQLLVRDEVEIEVLPRINLELLEIVGVNFGYSSIPPFLHETEHASLHNWDDPLYIWGRFSDGELHYINEFGLEFECQSLDPTIVSVTKGRPNFDSKNTCWVRLLKPGIARIKITRGDKQYIQKIQVHSTEEESLQGLHKEPFLNR